MSLWIKPWPIQASDVKPMKFDDMFDVLLTITVGYETLFPFAIVYLRLFYTHFSSIADLLFELCQCHTVICVRYVW